MQVPEKLRHSAVLNLKFASMKDTTKAMRGSATFMKKRWKSVVRIVFDLFVNLQKNSVETQDLLSPKFVSTKDAAKAMHGLHGSATFVKNTGSLESVARIVLDLFVNLRRNGAPLVCSLAAYASPFLYALKSWAGSIYSSADPFVTA